MIEILIMTRLQYLLLLLFCMFSWYLHYRFQLFRSSRPGKTRYKGEKPTRCEYMLAGRLVNCVLTTMNEAMLLRQWVIIITNIRSQLKKQHRLCTVSKEFPDEEIHWYLQWKIRLKYLPVQCCCRKVFVKNIFFIFYIYNFNFGNLFKRQFSTFL